MFLPIAMKISAKSLSTELVAVKPMSAPKMFYMNFINDDKKNIRKNKIENIFKK